MLLARNEVRRQTKNGEIQRFENTFFLLIDELKKNKHQIDSEIVRAILLKMQMLCVIEKDERQKRVDEMDDKGSTIEHKMYKEMLERYSNVIHEMRIWEYHDFLICYKYIRKILELIKMNEKNLDNSEYYVDFISINGSELVLTLAMYESLLSITDKEGMFDLLHHFNLFETTLRLNEDAIDKFNDYKMFQYIGGLNDRSKIDPWHINL
jgi:hypothetical protein